VKWAWLLFSLLLFAIATDWVSGEWPLVWFRAGACALCAAWLVAWAFRGEAIRWHPIAALVAAVPAWAALQAGLGWSVAPELTWRAAVHWVALAAVLFVALQLTALRACLGGIALFGGVFSCFAMAQYLSSAGKVFWLFPSGGDERVLGSFLNQNHYSALMELLFPIALWRFFRDRNQALYGLCAVAILGSVVMGGSRMGIGLLLVEALLVGMRVSRRPAHVLGGVVLVAALAALAVWPRIDQLRGASPYASRSETARASMEMIRSRPLTGFGVGTWARVYPAFAATDTGFRLVHADDDWLEWAAEGGAPLAVMMLVLGFFAVLAGYREPWSVGCAAVLIHSLVEFPLHKLSIWACFVVVLAMAYLNRESALRKHSS
jgi:O-antigen ligase